MPLMHNIFSLGVYQCTCRPVLATVAHLVDFQPISPIFEGILCIHFGIHVICRPVIILVTERTGGKV